MPVVPEFLEGYNIVPELGSGPRSNGFWKGFNYGVAGTSWLAMSDISFDLACISRELRSGPTASTSKVDDDSWPSNLDVVDLRNFVTFPNKSSLFIYWNLPPRFQQRGLFVTF
jgi:hypothetical protein